MNLNTAGKWIVFAYGLPDHATPGEPITGDAANITANIRIDGGAANAVDDTNPAELEDGYYIFDITAVESNGDLLLLAPASSTANVQVIAVPGAVYTRPANFNALGIAADGDISGNVDGSVASVTGSVASVTGAVASVTAAVVTDAASRTASKADVSGLATSAALATVDANIDTILVDTNELQTNQGNWSTATGFSTFNPATDTVANVTTVATTTTNTDMRGTDSAALATALATAQTDLDKITGTDGATLATAQGNYAPSKAGDNMGLTAGGATTATADMDANSTKLSAIETDTGTTIPAQITSRSLATADYFDYTTDRVVANTDQIAGSATAATNLSKSALGIEPGAAITGTLSSTQMTTDLTEASDDHYIGRVIIWTSGALANQGTDITDYTGSSKLLTYTATTEAPSNGDTFVIV